MTERGAERRAEPGQDPGKLRNLGVVAHINAGKTTLTERILFDSGRQRVLGDVDSGTATTDWLREEQDRGISISAAVTSVRWRGHKIQLIDTPGHVDFAAEVERCLRVLDGAVVVLDGVRGVETQTRMVWRSIEKMSVPRLCFVNKLDRPTADFEACLRSLRDELEVCPVVMVAPILHQGVLSGLIDAVGRRFVVWGEAAPPERERVEALHHDLVELCADQDEAVFADFVEGRDVEPARLIEVLRRATQGGELLPVFAGSALENHGIEPLLDGVCQLLPSPLDRLQRAPDGGFLALAFKAHDEHDGSGPEALIRIYRGELRVGDWVETASGDRFELSSIWELHALERNEREVAGVGELVAIPTPELLRTGETLREPGGTEVLEPQSFSAPVLTASIEPHSSADREELRREAVSLAAEDPTLEILEDPDLGGILVRGMGELHLEVFAERLGRVVSEPPRVGKPRVLRSESAAAAACGEAVCARTLGEHAIEARAAVFIEPVPERESVLFRWAVPEDALAPELRADLSASLESLGRAGFGSGRPVRGLAVEVRELAVEGPEEMAAPLLQEALALACRRAMLAGGLRLLEPWAEVEVDVPAEAVGVTLADLESRGARITEVLAEGADTRILAAAPLARLLGYATSLRSMTKGRGQFELRLAGFATA